MRTTLLQINQHQSCAFLLPRITFLNDFLKNLPCSILIAHVLISSGKIYFINYFMPMRVSFPRFLFYDFYMSRVTPIQSSVIWITFGERGRFRLMSQLGGICSRAHGRLPSFILRLGRSWI